MCWDPDRREPLHSFTLKNVKTLSQIIPVNETNLWCVTTDKIIVVDTSSNDFPVLQKLLFFDQSERSSFFEYALKINRNEVWGVTKTTGRLISWDTNTCKSEQINFDGDDLVDGAGGGDQADGSKPKSIYFVIRRNFLQKKLFFSRISFLFNTVFNQFITGFESE